MVYFVNFSSKSTRFGRPISCSSYPTRTVGCLIFTMRFKSVGARFVQEYGGEIKRIAMREGRSTTGIIEAIKRLP